MRQLFFSVFFLFIINIKPLYALDDFVCNKEIENSKWNEILSKVQSRYAGFSDIKAIFYQRSVFMALNQEQLSRGEVSFKKPGKMDWQYTEPDEQRFISDGETLWYYQPKLNQVTLSSFKQSFSSDVPVTFLLGLGEIKEKFVVDAACVTNVGMMLKLHPNVNDPQLQEFYLLVSSKTHEPLGARIVDIGGNETEILLFKMQTNTNLTNEQFKFNIPQGTDIINQANTSSKSIGSAVIID